MEFSWHEFDDGKHHHWFYLDEPYLQYIFCTEYNSESNQRYQRIKIIQKIYDLHENPGGGGVFNPKMDMGVPP